MTVQELYTTLYEEMTEGEVSPYAEVITADGQPILVVKAGTVMLS